MFTKIRSGANSEKNRLRVCALVLCVLALASLALTGCSGLVESATPSKPADSGTTPGITSLSPTSGAIGSSVTINGANFGATQGASTVKFNGTTATATSWSATSIIVTVPAGATTGDVVVTVGGVASPGVVFTITTTAPSISSLNPTSGSVGATVTITGTNFGATQGTSTVKFNGTAATSTSWTATSIVVTVPTGATTGNVVVTVGGVASAGVAFTVTTTPSPSITSLNPTSGLVGATVTIAGANFGATQGTSTVKFNGTTATATSWSATSIGVTVPTGATTGNVVVTVGGVASNGVSFTVTVPAPSITSLNPTSGNLGATVTIAGANFGATQGTSTVKFNGIAATATSWSAASIVVTVPAGATTGNVVVTVGGVASNGVSFTVTSPGPSITGLNPTSGLVGATVTIAGANFGATQGTSTVKFNGTAATATSWSATSIVVTVPTGATTGNVVVTVGGVASNGVSFTVTVPAPSITSLNPTSGLVGATVTITGANFGATQGTSTVKFNGTAATPTSWTATSIVTLVPTGATTGNVVVTVGGVASNGVSFTVTVLTPSLTSLNPTSGVVGASVTIAGTNFGATQGTSTVKFNGTAATATSWSATSIVVTVPAGATTGNVVVTVGGVASNGVSFTVTVPAPSITSLNPTSGFVSTSVTINGTNFGATQGTSTVKFNGTAAAVTSWSATSIVVTVPTGATTGSVVVTVGGVASNGVAFTVQADTTPPTVPTGLTATAVSGSQINLSWNASTDPNVAVTGYNVYRGGTQVGTSNTTSYSDTGLAPSTTYTYTVAAYDAVGNTSAQSTSASATTSSSTAGCASGLPCTLGWYAIPNTALQPVIPTYAEDLLNSTGDPGQAAVMSAWGGALFDTQRNLFCVKGQGHVDGYGNDIECWNFDATPIAPFLLKDASHGSQVANVGSSPEEYSDGSPSARHTYNGFIYEPTQDQYWFMGAFRSENGNSSNYNYTFDPCTGIAPFCATQSTIASGSNGWTQYLPSNGPQPGTDGSIPVWAYDPVTDAIYGVQANSGEFWEYNPAANTWTALASNGGCGNDSMTAALDPVNRFFYCIGGGPGTGSFSKVSLNSPYTVTDLSTASGCSTLINNAAPGFDWDPVQQLFVGWAGGNTYYTFNPATATCTANTVGTFTGGPTTISAAGTYKRFQYASTLGGFVLVNDINSDVYFLRLVSAGAAATTDFNQRIAANGVTTSQTFSNASFLTMTDSNRDNAPMLNCNSANLTAPATCPQIFQDTSVYSTGTGSMRMDCTSQSGAQCSGYWYMYLSPSIANGTIPGYWTNTDIWVSVHVRGNTEMFTTDWESVTGTTYKHWIMHQAYPDFGSCSNVEVTEVQDGENLNGNNPYPNYYSQCGDLAFVDSATTGANQTGVTNNVTCTESSPCDQEGVPGYWCHYPTFTDCLTWSSVPNTWMVETYHIHLGTSGGSNSTMDAWLNKAGRPPRQFMHLTGLNMVQDAGCPGTWATGNDCYFQVLDFLVYGTDADMSAAHPTGSVWIGDVVVAINPTTVCLANHPCAIPLPNVPPANWP